MVRTGLIIKSKRCSSHSGNFKSFRSSVPVTRNKTQQYHRGQKSPLYGVYKLNKKPIKNKWVPFNQYSFVVSWGSSNTLPRTWQLKSIECFLSRFWRPGVWNQTGICYLWRPWDRVLPHLGQLLSGASRHSLADGCLTPRSASIFLWPPLPSLFCSLHISPIGVSTKGSYPWI